MYEPVNVLIVCTVNIFRSASAGYLIQQHLDDIDEERFRIKTAGTKGDINKTMDEKTGEELNKRGIDASQHTSTKLNGEHVDWADTIIAMADYHQTSLQEDHNAQSLLYNELAKGEQSNVDDIDDRYRGENLTRANTEKHIEETVTYLDETTPDIVEELQTRHFLFREFAIGDRDHHVNGAPFNPLIEEDNAMAFLSLDIPDTMDTHVLVVPKQRYKYLDDIPSSTKQRLFEIADTFGTIFKEQNGGYNVVVNNGSVAGQHIFHTHIHLIPRQQNDEIDIEHWQHTTVNSEEHESLRSSLADQIQDYR